MARITKAAIDRLPVGGEIWEDGIFYRKGKKGGTWWITYYVGTRQKKERIGKDSKKVTKRKAQEALAARQGEVVQGRFDMAKTKRAPLFKDFAKEYLAWSKQTKKSWDSDEYRLRHHLTPFFGEHSLNEITPWIIEKYRSMRGKNNANKSTINREVALLKAVFNKAILWGKARENPVKHVKLYRENNTIIRFLSRSEARSLLDACNNLLKPIVLLALNTGMRKGEIFKLQWRDVDLKRGILKIRDSKDGTDAHISINENVKELLSELPRFDDNPHVFPGMKSAAPLNNVRHSWQTALKKAGIKNFRFHDMRHTFASWMIMEGVDLYTVKDLMRHKSIEMTMRYAHLAPEHKKAAVECLGALISGITTPLQPQIEDGGAPTETNLSVIA
jgi:integrase